ncbi:patatin-like phospholipase family protein [Actinocatenispora sera]|jgi:NTE family protein|uniref:Patatin n=1 Tax=Actinocatenispora sera TaxID=390989 RepID=A0A810L1E7_9ACTN|nr:patatin-like phospholipase family protein [Actinocatenispora sera]BCJ28669.1 patatin [Actinocatenispora sera]
MYPQGTTRRALVLGAGGVVGTAWMAGLAAGLPDSGIDLADSDVFVGTSAGAIIGALLATGERPERLAALPPTTGHPHVPDPAVLAEVFAVLSEPGQDAAVARRRVGQLARTTDVAGPYARIDSMRGLLGTTRFPERLRVTAVDADTGEPVVWDRDSDIPLPQAVAASTAFPGVSPPIPIGGRYYLDGGLRSATNADLATDADTLVVVEPLAHLFPPEQLRQELTATRATTVVTLRPDAAAITAFGTDPYDRAVWADAYRAGKRQSIDAAERLRHLGTGG